MAEFSNGLTPAQAERLALLAEEMAESIQVIGKILRHGYDSRHPYGGPTNRQLLEKELGHTACALHMMQAATDVSPTAIRQHLEAKHDTISQYLHHQD